ncbi:MAG: hypothetical protein NTZ78_14290 [Candidatus Aureabacteria bacterium]|nr:hypothetical protein [Candidatus Auribacterota bacterium]
MSQKRNWIVPAVLISVGACALFFSLALPRPGEYLVLNTVADGKYRLGEMVTVHWSANQEILRGRKVDVCYGLAEVEPPWNAGLVSVGDLLSRSRALYFFNDALLPTQWQEGMPVPVVKGVSLGSYPDGAIFFIVTPEIESKTMMFWAIFIDHATGEFIDPVLPVATSSHFETRNPARPTPDQVSIDGGDVVGPGR